MDTVRVAVIDDHAVVREGVETMVGTADDLEFVGQAGSAEEARQLIRTTMVDVVLVDVGLPDGSGIDIVRDARSRYPYIRWLILTANPNDDTFLQAVVAGAMGFLAKAVTTEELLSAVRRVATGESLIRREMLDELRARARELPPETEIFPELTPQERRILKMVAMGLTNREIGARLRLGEKTVRNYVSNILGKVGARNRTQLAAYVAQHWAGDLAPRQRGR